MNKLPISLKYIQHIIDKISIRYPLIDKTEITVIIKTLLETMRDILLAGDRITVRGLFSGMHLVSLNHIWNNKFVRTIKIKMKTSRKIKNEQ